MAWTGRVSFGEGWAAYRGEADQQSPHAHATLQLVVAARGDVAVELGSGTVIAPGVLLAPRVRHLTRPSAAELTFVYVEPHAPLGRSLLARLGGKKAAPADPTNVAVIRSGPRLEESIGSLFAAEPALRLDERLASALRSIESNIASRTAVADAAMDAKLSPSRLRAIAQVELGLPLAQWIVWCKLARAGRALARGETLVQAATAGGFADQAHLTRTMRRTFGVTPGAVARPVRRGALNA